MTLSLYRKYRPLDFDSLLGQDHIRDVLKAAIEQSRVSHAYLFTGPRGTGKTSTARILARSINCLQPSSVGPCNTCEICRASLEDRLTDMIEIDAASHGLVDDARALVEQARFLPVQAKKKIYIIDEVHMLSKSAFNALLKIIEEPPDHVHFILATTEANKVLETIRSRCQRFDFHLADDELIAAHLSQVCRWENVSPDEQAITLLSSYGRGSFRDALSLLEQLIGYGDFTLEQVRSVLGIATQDFAVRFLSALKSSDQVLALSIIHELHEEGHDLRLFCESILQLLRKTLQDSNTDRGWTISTIEHFFHCLDHLRDPVIPELPLELAVLKSISHPEHHERSIPEHVSEKSTDHATPLGTQTLKFLDSIQHIPLRRLLKDSELQFQGSELIIIARTEFEHQKLKERENVDHLQSALKHFSSNPVTIHFELKQKKQLNEGDIKAVFQ